MQMKLHYSNRTVVHSANNEIIDATQLGEKLRRDIRKWFFGPLCSTQQCQSSYLLYLKVFRGLYAIKFWQSKKLICILFIFHVQTPLYRN